VRQAGMAVLQGKAGIAVLHGSDMLVTSTFATKTEKQKNIKTEKQKNRKRQSSSSICLML
jgi:hypothetical protein